MLKNMLLLGLVLAVVTAYPQGTKRVRRYYYNEDRHLQSNDHSRRDNTAIKGGETSVAGQSSASYNSGTQGNSGRHPYSQGYPQGNSGQRSYQGPYDQEPYGHSSYTQVSDHSFDQGRNLYRQNQVFQRQNHGGGYQEFGY